MPNQPKYLLENSVRCSGCGGMIYLHPCLVCAMEKARKNAGYFREETPERDGRPTNANDNRPDAPHC